MVSTRLCLVLILNLLVILSGGIKYAEALTKKECISCKFIIRSHKINKFLIISI